jgi:hypothetical protein
MTLRDPIALDSCGGGLGGYLTRDVGVTDDDAVSVESGGGAVVCELGVCKVSCLDIVHDNFNVERCIC